MDPTDFDQRRAVNARHKLISDIRELRTMGNKMIKTTETTIHKAPLLLGAGALGVALLGGAIVGVALLAGRRQPAFRFPGRSPQRSLLSDAVRSVALSALGVLGGRITQRLLVAAAGKPESGGTAALPDLAGPRG